MSETFACETECHLNNLKLLFDSSESNASSSLKEYFQCMSNTIAYDSSAREERRKVRNVKFHNNDNTNENSKSNVKINQNIDYCEACKLDYWPSNCCVFTVPKCRFTSRNARLYTRHKCLDYKAKYKSYKHHVLQNLLVKGVQLVYECKRCKARNVVFKEIKRNTNSLKTVDLSGKKSIDRHQNLKNRQIIPPTLLNKTTIITNSETVSATAVVSISKKAATKRRFQSLQHKLKESETKQAQYKEQKQSGSASLLDFLQRL